MDRCVRKIIGLLPIRITCVLETLSVAYKILRTDLYKKHTCLVAVDCYI